MCGLTGIWDRKAASSADELARRVELMRETLVRRGPDDAGTWVDSGSGVALGFRRLAIVDLSPTGHQPMSSADGRYVMVYNGEIYNYRELRGELEALGVGFRGTSDTEVMLEGFGRWGVRPTLERLIGMFAIALWDCRKRTLHLVRDRLGIKPMYWAQFGSLVLFGSELKALRAHPGWAPEIDQGAASAYLRFAYVPAPRTIYQGVQKLEPGSHLQIGTDGDVKIDAFWRLPDVVHAGHETRFAFSDSEATDHLEELLMDAVGRRMVADVPLGAFLSGGIDSSTVVALMQRQSDRPVRTFTIGFREQGFDEATHAAAVARHLGTDHTELYIDPGHARDLIPSLPDHYDEPFADSSQIPTYLISELTRQHVTVALSGDGGDELFAGYNRYVWAENLWKRLALAPKFARSSVARMLVSLSPGGWDSIFRIVPVSRRPSTAGDKVHKLASMLALDNPDAVYRQFVSQWEDPGLVMPQVPETRGLLFDPSVADIVPDFKERMRYLDTLTYLPDDILTKVDRASMAVSLEARVPLLDHRVVAFAWRLPPHFLVRDGVSKWLLREVLHRHVPRALIDRPKMGFGVPIDAWLRGPLREWAENFLTAPALQEAGMEPNAVRRCWQQHLSGDRNWQHKLWAILMLQAWRQRWMQH